MELQELIKVLLRNKAYLLLIPIVSAVLAFTLRFNTNRTYIAESQMSTGLTVASDLVGENRRLAPFEIALSFGNITENMSSKLVINRLSYKILYRELTTSEPFRIPDLEGADIIAPQGDTLELVLKELELAIENYRLINRTSDLGYYIYELMDKYAYGEEDLIENSKIYRVGNTDFINIKFSSEVPELSAYIVNIWIDNFLEYYNYQKKNFLKESMDVLSQILSEKQSLLDQSTEKLNRYKSRYIYRSPESEGDPVSEYERLIREKESNLRSIDFRLQDIRESITHSDQSTSFKSRQRIIRIKNDIDRLSTRLISESSNKQLADSLEILRKELQSQMYLHTSSSSDKNNLDDLFKEENKLKVEYQIAIADLQKLKSQYQIERGMVQNMAANKSVLDNLETEVQQARDEFITAQDKYNQARSQMLTGGSGVKLSYYGDIPEKPESRKTIIFTGAGFMGGFIVTLFLILGLEFIDFRLKNVFKFERATGFKPTELLPIIKDLNHRFGDILNASELHDEILLRNGFIQTIKKIRYSLLNKSNSKTILVTSLRPTAGKSFLITSLAYAFGLLEKKVLIFDTNFRNCDLTKELSLKEGSSAKSLYTLINSGNQVDFSKPTFISRTSNKNVHIIKSEAVSKTPEEVFAKSDFQQILKNLEERYDVILIEGAALNDFSDSRELIKYSKNLVCVYSGHDDYSNNDDESLEFLLDSTEGKNVIHVLNQLNEKEAITK